jgi:hypothetical protein
VSDERSWIEAMIARGRTIIATSSVRNRDLARGFNAATCTHMGDTCSDMGEIVAK